MLQDEVRGRGLNLWIYYPAWCSSQSLKIQRRRSKFGELAVMSQPASSVSGDSVPGSPSSVPLPSPASNVSLFWGDAVIPLVNKLQHIFSQLGSASTIDLPQVSILIPWIEWTISVRLDVICHFLPGAIVAIYQLNNAALSPGFKGYWELQRAFNVVCRFQQHSWGSNPQLF